MLQLPVTTLKGMRTEDEASALGRARDAIAEATQRLEDAGVPREHVAAYVPPRRRLLRTQRATMTPISEAWRVGSILLAPDGQLRAVGSCTRAAERGRPGYQDLAHEERKELAAAAVQGGFPVGTPVNYDTVPLALDTLAEDEHPTRPIGIADREVRVRWRPGAPLADAPTLAAFLRERVSLLIEK